MNRKAVSGIMLTVLMLSTLTLAFNIQRVKPEDEPAYEAYLGDWIGDIAFEKKYDYDRLEEYIGFAGGPVEILFGWHMRVEIESSWDLTIKLGEPEHPDNPVGIGRANFTITVKDFGFIRDFYRVDFTINQYYEYTLLDYGPPHIRVQRSPFLPPEEGDETLSFSTRNVDLVIYSEGTAVLHVLGQVQEAFYVLTMPITYQIDNYVLFGGEVIGHSTEVVEDIIYFSPSGGYKFFEVDMPDRNVITLAYEHESTGMPYYERAIGELHRVGGKYILTIGSATGGTTDPSPGSYEYDVGTEVEVTAYPDEIGIHYVLKNWTLDGTIVDPDNPITILMDSDHTLTPIFGLYVCIDPGHNPMSEPLEYAINKGVADKLKSKLDAEGITVNLTNPSDGIVARANYVNNLKPEIFVSLHCNAFQGFDKEGKPIGTSRGSEVWVYDDTDSSEQAINEHDLAVRALNGLTKEIGSKSRLPIPKEKESPWDGKTHKCHKVPWDGGYWLGIPILNGNCTACGWRFGVTICPAVLLEMEFFDYSGEVTYKGITYPNMLELMNTDTWQEDAAQGIANGILGYFEERGLTIKGYSPVDIVVTDPNGLAISKQFNEILEATYAEIDLDGDGDLDDQIRIPDRKIGDYTITVLPESGALPTDTFTLEVSLFGIPIIIAENVQINDIPSQPYIVTSTETEIIPIIPIIPATVNFDPDTLNLKSKGKVTTIYIELPAGYDVSRIDVSSIQLNGTVPALAKPTEIGDYDGDGVPHLMVKFNRQDLIAILSVGEATLTITGEVDGITFEGSDTIRVIDE